MLKWPLLSTLKYHLKWKKYYNTHFAHYPDRIALHEHIFPGFAGDPKIGSVLDVGCEFYNLHHQRLFKTQEYATIDYEADRKAFGAKRHVTGSVTELDKYFKEGEFDLVIANGIIGHGVTSAEDVQKMAEQVAFVLKSGGKALIGWNDRGEDLPALHPDKAFPAAGFKEADLPHYGEHKFLATPESKHWYELYEKA